MGLDTVERDKDVAGAIVFRFEASFPNETWNNRYSGDSWSEVPMETVNLLLKPLAAALFLGWCFQWLLHIVAIIYGMTKLHRRSLLSSSSPSSVELASFVGVTILKPLIGVDSNLYANLETFFTLTYPKYEILFCVENVCDPSVMVVQGLMSKYPTVDARLFVGNAKNIGINPKINNLAQGYDSSKYDLLLISDSGIKMSQNGLIELVEACREDNTGLVHQLPFVTDMPGFAGIVDKIYFGTQHARMYLIANILRINCVTGMSCLFRKSVLDDAGGMAALANYLAEDYYLGQVFLSRGWKVKLSSQPTLQNSGTSSVQHFQARMIRWAKLRVSLAPLTMVFEPISECILLGVITSWSVGTLFDWSGAAFILVHLLIWFLLDYILLLVIQGGPLPFSKFDYVIGWLYREMTSLYLTTKAYASSKIMWRNRIYLVRRGATGIEVNSRSNI